jgi:hypothetical protein
MQQRVSKRDRKRSTETWSGGRRNSESNSWSDALRCLPIWPKDLADRSREGRRKLIAIIEREMRKERRLGLAGHRSYDVARHAKLTQLLKEERRLLGMLERASHARRMLEAIELR